MTVEQARAIYLTRGSIDRQSFRACGTPDGRCPCSRFALATDAASLVYDLAVSEWAARKAVAY